MKAELEVVNIYISDKRHRLFLVHTDSHPIHDFMIHDLHNYNSTPLKNR